jgi:hypothetical protein
MALDLSTIDHNVNDNLAAPAAPPSGNDDDLAGQLAKAVAEIALIKAEREREAVEREASVAAERLKVAATIAKQRGGKVGCTEQDLQLDRAIAKCGGLAYFNKLTPAQKAEALGIEGAADTSDKTLRQYFGLGSDSGAANRLATSNPAEYRRLRGLARLKGIL